MDDDEEEEAKEDCICDDSDVAAMDEEGVVLIASPELPEELPAVSTMDVLVEEDAR